MRTMDEKEMLVIAEAAIGSTVFCSYVVGRPPTERQQDEARRHTEDPARPRRYLYGELTDLRRNRFGEWYLTLFAENRDTVRNGVRYEGGYRSLNPSLGKLIVLEVVRAGEG